MPVEFVQPYRLARSCPKHHPCPCSDCCEHVLPLWSNGFTEGITNRIYGAFSTSGALSLVLFTGYSCGSGVVTAAPSKAYQQKGRKPSGKSRIWHLMIPLQYRIATDVRYLNTLTRKCNGGQGSTYESAGVWQRQMHASLLSFN